MYLIFLGSGATAKRPSEEAAPVLMGVHGKSQA